MPLSQVIKNQTRIYIKDLVTNSEQDIAIFKNYTPLFQYFAMTCEPEYEVGLDGTGLVDVYLTRQELFTLSDLIERIGVALVGYGIGKAFLYDSGAIDFPDDFYKRFADHHFCPQHTNEAHDYSARNLIKLYHCINTLLDFIEDQPEERYRIGVVSTGTAFY